MFEGCLEGGEAEGSMVRREVEKICCSGGPRACGLERFRVHRGKQPQLRRICHFNKLESVSISKLSHEAPATRLPLTQETDEIEIHSPISDETLGQGVLRLSCRPPIESTDETTEIDSPRFFKSGDRSSLSSPAAAPRHQVVARCPWQDGPCKPHMPFCCCKLVVVKIHGCSATPALPPSAATTSRRRRRRGGAAAEAMWGVGENPPLPLLFAVIEFIMYPQDHRQPQHQHQYHRHRHHQHHARRPDHPYKSCSYHRNDIHSLQGIKQVRFTALRSWRGERQSQFHRKHFGRESQ